MYNNISKPLAALGSFLATLFVAGTVLAATPEKAPVTPPEPPQMAVQLTPTQIAYVERALYLAAGTCQTQQDGCVIGVNMNSILQSLQSAKVVK